MQYISSTQNSNIKKLVRLAASKRERGLSGLFVIESAKLACEAALSGIKIRALYLTEAAAERYGDELAEVFSACSEQTLISEAVSQKLATSVSPQGVYCLCEIPSQRPLLDELSSSGRYLLLSSIQDPGNLGTIIRSSVAFGADGLILSADCPDIYSPKVLRSAMGGVFRLPTAVVEDAEQAVELLRGRGLRVYAAALDRDAARVDELNLSQGCVVAVGNEGNGLPERVIQACTQAVFIPIAEQSESLNAAVAASVFLWEMSKK